MTIIIVLNALSIILMYNFFSVKLFLLIIFKNNIHHLFSISNLTLPWSAQHNQIMEDTSFFDNDNVSSTTELKSLEVQELKYNNGYLVIDCDVMKCRSSKGVTEDLARSTLKLFPHFLHMERSSLIPISSTLISQWKNETAATLNVSLWQSTLQSIIGELEYLGKKAYDAEVLRRAAIWNISRADYQAPKTITMMLETLKNDRCQGLFRRNPMLYFQMTYYIFRAPLKEKNNMWAYDCANRFCVRYNIDPSCLTNTPSKKKLHDFIKIITFANQNVGAQLSNAEKNAVSCSFRQQKPREGKENFFEVTIPQQSDDGNHYTDPVKGYIVVHGDHQQLLFAMLKNVVSLAKMSVGGRAFKTLESFATLVENAFTEIGSIIIILNFVL